ncbi:hypothetical protein FH972_015190 [Carpinus fangiana]|uniref:Uncharacterized protein n=1 Tax=Carpinus fangiana TaxID=176857 RepID=A0A5N6RF79_9ROSI|nr:hypothetical protein FH972_015190 [Carpinus fangiana]
MGNMAEDLTKQMKNVNLMEEECIMVATDKTVIKTLEVWGSSCLMGNYWQIELWGRRSSRLH